MRNIPVTILFTSSNLIGSKIIRKVTGEPVSHCAVRVGEYVISAGPFDVQIIPFSHFQADHTIHFSVRTIAPSQVALDKNVGKMYDFLGLLFLGIRYLLPKKWTPKVNLWQSSGMFICTECVTDILGPEPDSLITPYQLYLKLDKPLPTWE